MNSVFFNGEKIQPTKVVCVGRNYVEHITELGNEVPVEPVIFLKPNSAISDKLLFNHDDAIHYEAELTFLVRSGQLSAVGFGLDLTKRAIQSQLKAKQLPWERSKAFDHSAVFGEFVEIEGEIADLSLLLSINGRVVQQGGYTLMLYKPQSLLTEIQSFLSLEDGDLIMTGTPKGVGVIALGDVFEGKIFLKNKVIAEQAWVVC
ncbi:MAG: fumarylacetoacetate hydrolase family protein [Gammaproteobacteria bacterium]|nr:fumarylacetoacetate hydrolase family protein [Gammaproteobacteria bacterium]